MNKVWAPWRMDFIEDVRGKSPTECVFCDILKHNVDREKLILHHGTLASVVMNKYPYTNGHLLVMPKRHIAELHDLTRDEHAEMMALMAASIPILRNVLGAQGINCGLNLGKVAGAGILDHVHFHIVPRWVGDSNFFPVIAETRSIPEYVQKTYDRLIGEFQKMGEI
ncbi:MAG: HIT domain-containing protein [Deltaproteobacteria bacterium]|nr:HIT domain-containing protein [Deltaproteobacteria bacterium]